MAVVRKMLEVTNAGKNDLVVDLGSGEGRICITAALEYGAKAMGIELDPFLANKSREIVREMGLQVCHKFMAAPPDARNIMAQ
jgi:cyclopropane fatty-acyl-phospholipid synthase-like methyltransferase